MTFEHKKIPLLNSKFKNIKISLILVGGGRWANIILNELVSNFKNLQKIFIITKNKNIIDKLPPPINKKIYISKNLNNINLKKITHGIIANKNNDHYLYSKKILKKNINILVEKPLVKNIKEFEILKKYSRQKKKIVHVSMPFFFAYYFSRIKRLINENNTQLTFEWHDPKNDKRHGIIKKYDKSISYLEDTLYHIFGIMNCLFGSKKIVYKSSKNFINKGYLIFSYGKIYVKVNCSRNQTNKRIRKINISANNKIIKVNYCNDNNVIAFVNGRKKNLNFNFNQNTLKYQLFNFLNTKNYSKNYSLNDIRNLDSLFYLIKQIR